MRKDMNAQLLHSVYCLLFGILFLTLSLVYQTAEAGSKKLPGPDPSAKLITGYWSAHIDRVNGEHAEQIAKKTYTLYWKTFFDAKAKKAHYYRINDHGVDSTETLEGYPKVLFISDARVELGKHLQGFVSHGKKNKLDTIYYAHLGAWKSDFGLTEESSFSYANGIAEMNAGHKWSGGLDGVWKESKGEGTIAIWDGKKYQEIFLTNVTFSVDGYADPQVSRKHDSKIKPRTPEQKEAIQGLMEFLHNPLK